MERFLHGKLDQTQKSHASWLVTTIKKLIIRPVKDIGQPVFFFKRTQEAAHQNINILDAFNGNLGAEMEYQDGIPLDYS